MIVAAAATREYLKRDLTTPPTSVSILAAEQIVVSETRARLSPKQPPPIIAPVKGIEFAPSIVPAGYKTDMHATIAPKPVPADVANRHTARNDTMINTFPVHPVYTRPI